MRYQQEAVVAAAAGAAPKSAAPSPPGAAALARAGSDAAGLAAALAGAGTGVLQGLGLGGGEDGGVAGEEAGGLHSVPNLSNRWVRAGLAAQRGKRALAGQPWAAWAQPAFSLSVAHFGPCSCVCVSVCVAWVMRRNRL